MPMRELLPWPGGARPEGENRDREVSPTGKTAVARKVGHVQIETGRSLLLRERKIDNEMDTFRA